MKNFFKNNPWVASIILFLAGLALGWQTGVQKGIATAISGATPLRPANLAYKFINPLIGFDISSEQTFPELKHIKEGVGADINQAISDKKLTDVGVYFRNVNNGHWFGINENEKFYPGSLLKVPLMIAYFKDTEKDSSALSKKLYFAGHNSSTNAPQVGDGQNLLTAGGSYSIGELISGMIVKSDNDAKDILFSNIGINYFKEVFSDFGIQLPDIQNYTISPKEYGVFFRRLYNATYLDRELSENALKLLSQVEFKSGLRAGVPENIAMAHKFGERGVYEENRLAGAELHDCGIIYFPKEPYLLCVMTGGSNAADLPDMIKTISQTVYEDIKSQ